MTKTLVNKYSEVKENTTMRDSVIGRLYDLSDIDHRICLFTADMGAKALDLWRKREEMTRDGRFSEFGIAEQAMASVAAGVAKEGKRPFIYAIANFVTKRIHEFHILNAGVQKLPYVTLGVGTGFSYPDSGPTHYMLEDIAIMRTVPNLEILSPSDSVMAAELAEQVAKADNPVYMRLERFPLPINTHSRESFEQGFRELRRGKDGVIISTGTMLSRALEVQDALREKGRDYGVIDIYRLKPLNQTGLMEALNGYNRIVTLEEHFLIGGLGSMMSEMITDNNLPLRLHRIGVNNQIPYQYGRENMQKNLGIDKDSVVKKIESYR